MYTLNNNLIEVKYICSWIVWTTGQTWICPISGFRREVDEICTLLGYCAAYSGSSVPTFRDS